MNIFFIIIILIIIELLLIFTVNILKKKFQWLITNEDEYPFFDDKKLKNFYKNTFDSLLGWDRKKNSKGYEYNQSKKTSFSINKYGARGKNHFSKNKITVFGDSYAFCRYVNDNQTWENLIQKKIKGNVFNYGIGNFGIDQAILKIDKIKKKNISKIIIINVVPETILRIHSFWKHYLEFGNHLGFKPKYIIKNKKLTLLKSPIKKNYSENEIYSKIEYLKKNDIFYEKKFSKLKFSFPYTIKFLNKPIRNSKIFYYIILFQIFNFFTLKKIGLHFYQKAFGIIVNENIIMSHKMYKNHEYTELFNELIKNFSKKIKKDKKKLIILITPQLFDLNNFKSSVNYRNFFQSLKKEYNVYDLSSYFKKQNYAKYYTNDKYGGHLSYNGNKIVSKLLYNYLKKGKFL